MIKIITHNFFDKSAKKLNKKFKKIVSDLKKLKQTLESNPKSGIYLGKNLYKIRLKNSDKNTGKRGGYRVIYYYFDKSQNLIFLDIYDKSEQENFDEEKILAIIKEI